MNRIEFHCHTKYSKCSNLEPKQILKLCKNRGLQGVVICDHNTLEGVSIFKKILSDNEFILITGMEITTNRGEILGVWIEESPSTNEFPEVAEEIRQQGGMVIIPHPFDHIRTSAFKVREDDVQYIDAIEVLNSRCKWPNGNKRALTFANEHSLLKSAGSDAHFSSEVGTAWTSFNGNTEDELLRAFKDGRTEIGGKTAPFSLFFRMAAHRMRRTLKR